MTPKSPQSQISSIDKLLKAISRVSKFLDKDSFLDISKIFYDTVKISTLRLTRKKVKGKQKRQKCSLSKSNITSIVKLLHFFHTNNKYVKLKVNSKLAGCYHPNFNEGDALKYFERFLEGKTFTDKLNDQIYFPTDFYRSLYKDKLGRHIKKEEYYVKARGKRLPLIEHTILNTSNIYQTIDSQNTIEKMYVHRYVDQFNTTFYMVVIATKNKKDKTNPHRAKTAFPIFKYNDILRRIEKYEV
jgi:hypothetical protein